MQNPSPLFVVVFRTGGYARWNWRQSVAMSRQDADKACADTQRMGYPAYVQGANDALPTTFEVQVG